MSSDLITIRQQQQLQDKHMTGLNSDMLDSFIDFLDVSDATVKTYKNAIKRFLLWLSDNGINQPLRDDVVAFKRYLADRQLKPTTINNYLISLKQFFKWLNATGQYIDITTNVKSMKLDKSFKKDALTERQAKMLLKSIDQTTATGKRDYAIIGLLLTTGLRTVEVTRADVGDIRPVGEFMALYILGKGRTEKSEYVKLSPHVEDAIMSYLATREHKDADSPLFTSTSNNSKDGRLTTRTIRRLVKSYLRGINLDSDRMTAHSLRHTAGTLNLVKGGTLEETQQLLRHKNLQTTLIYSHALERAKNQSENRLDDTLF
jgi:integrase/recombinase XerC